MQPRLLAHAAAIVAIAGLSNARLQAQAEAEVPAPAQATATGDFGNGLLIGVNYGTPLRWAFSGGLFIHSHDLGNEGEGAVGTILGGSVGREGIEVWGGRKAVVLGGGDFRAVLTRTWNSPRGGASPNSTYLGGEVAFGGLVGRLSVGYARQIAGRAATMSSRGASESR